MKSKNQNLFANPDKSGQVVRRIVALGVVCMLLFAVVSCESEKDYASDEDGNDTEQLTSLKGTNWKLVGIVDAKTGILRELEPTHCVECYTLRFETDRIAHVRGVEFTAMLNLDELNWYCDAMLWCEEYDGNRYCDSNDFRCIGGARSYSVTHGELKLIFYHNGNPAEGIVFYMLFKRIDLST